MYQQNGGKPNLNTKKAKAASGTGGGLNRYFGGNNPTQEVFQPPTNQNEPKPYHYYGLPQSPEDQAAWDQNKAPTPYQNKAPAPYQNNHQPTSQYNNQKPNQQTNQYPNQQSNQYPKKQLPCFFCSEPFNSLQDVYTHQKQVHGRVWEKKQPGEPGQQRPQGGQNQGGWQSNGGQQPYGGQQNQGGQQPYQQNQGGQQPYRGQQNQGGQQPYGGYGQRQYGGGGQQQYQSNHGGQQQPFDVEAQQPYGGYQQNRGPPQYQNQYQNRNQYGQQQFQQRPQYQQQQRPPYQQHGQQPEGPPQFDPPQTMKSQYGQSQFDPMKSQGYGQAPYSPMKSQYGSPMKSQFPPGIKQQHPIKQQYDQTQIKTQGTGGGLGYQRPQPDLNPHVNENGLESDPDEEQEIRQDPGGVKAAYEMFGINPNQAKKADGESHLFGSGQYGQKTYEKKSFSTYNYYALMEQKTQNEAQPVENPEDVSIMEQTHVSSQLQLQKKKYSSIGDSEIYEKSSQMNPDTSNYDDMKQQLLSQIRY